jgi:hypothetical protein
MSGRNLLPAIVLAAAVAVAGWFIGQGFAAGRGADRYVTVKGIAEREVQADVAIWPLRFNAADNDLGKAYQQLQQRLEAIRSFLARQGFDPAQAELLAFSVTDAYANAYGAPERVGNRYIINQTLVVRSDDPEKVRRASSQVAELASAGVVLSSGGEYGGGGPTYLFTGLNDLKPEMIADATARAREAAEQFARDSSSSLGGIRRANQGTFEIQARDRAPGITEESQVKKTVRIVTTVEYALQY